MGQIGLHHDSLVTKKLLSSSLEHSTLRLASGYFNLTDTYMHTLTHDCPAKCSILMAHPNVSWNFTFCCRLYIWRPFYLWKRPTVFKALKDQLEEYLQRTLWLRDIFTKSSRKPINITDSNCSNTVNQAGHIMQRACGKSKQTLQNSLLSTFKSMSFP